MLVRLVAQKCPSAPAPLRVMALRYGKALESAPGTGAAVSVIMCILLLINGAGSGCRRACATHRYTHACKVWHACSAWHACMHACQCVWHARNGGVTARARAAHAWHAYGAQRLQRPACCHSREGGVAHCPPPPPCVTQGTPTPPSDPPTPRPGQLHNRAIKCNNNSIICSHLPGFYASRPPPTPDLSHHKAVWPKTWQADSPASAESGYAIKRGV